MKRLAVIIAPWFMISLSLLASGQSPTNIYDRVAPSVFVTEVREGTSTTSQATAFKVGSNQLLTNAHAVRGGQVWVRIGQVAVQARVVRTDELNDLALLELDAELATPSLELSATEMKPGVRVFAVGNPRGFERTISEGLIAGTRTVDGRTLLQISSPISPGSSGGPVVDETGNVVGVTVGTFVDGQNLNFAIPARIAREFLAGSSERPTNVASQIALANRLHNERGSLTYSDDTDSPYQKLNRQFEAALGQAIESASTSLQLTELWTLAAYGSDLEEKAARKNVTVAPASTAALDLLARTLNGRAVFADSTEVKQALRGEAEKHATKAVANAATAERPQALFTLATIQNADGRPSDAYKTFGLIKAPAGTDLARDTALGLFRVSRDLERKQEAKRWFDQAVASKQKLSGSDWEDLGEMLEDDPSVGDAALAYVQAADSANYLYHRYCSAAHIYANSGRTDEALSSARRCLERATKTTSGETHAKSAHYILSVMLRLRGVVDQAVSHARDAIAIDAADGYSHAALGQALFEARRLTEAEAELRAGIRLTDGAEAYMHFALGRTLFAQEKWNEAQRSFERAAEMDPADDSAAYNVAVSLVRQDYYRDAARWYEEALKRNANRSDAADIRERIRTLRR